MKILSYDKKRRIMKVVPHNSDDLWVMYNVIFKGDKVYARTLREVKKDEESIRPSKSKRVPLYLGLDVEKKLFQRRTDRLRINGRVVDAPEEFNIKGSYHTIAISRGNPITIVKEEWFEHDIERIERATKEKTLPIIVVSIDDEEACITVLHQSDFEVKNNIIARLPGKLETNKREKAVSEYFKNILGSLSRVWEARPHTKQGLIAVVGPGFWKDNFVKYIQKKKSKLTQRISLIGTVSCGGIGGAREALRSGILEKVSKKIRIIEESNVVKKILSYIGSNVGMVAYGFNDVERAVSYGAVELLLVSDELLREAENEERVRLEELMKAAGKKGGKIMIIDSEHEYGRILLGLGGVASILRYSI